MKIAVDTGAYAVSEGGIARYIERMLASLRVQAPQTHRWLLYGRGENLRALAHDGRTIARSDHLPYNLGRIGSLATSLPLWALADRPDVFWGPAHRLPLWLPATTARVVTIHDLCWRQAPDAMRATSRWLDTALMPRALRQADRIIAVSHATAADLAKAFPEAAPKIVSIAEGASPLPAPLEREALRAQGINMPFVLFVGTLEPRKNLGRLLEAFAALHRDRPSSPDLVVAGAAGWGQEALEALRDRLGLRDKVRILGRVSDQMLATLYHHALFLALPSRYEGFGLPLVEAMSVGTPVLTSNTASMPEVAGPAGLLVDPLSTESIARGLRVLMDDDALRARLASAAPAQAQLFSWERAARETLDTLRQAVDLRKRRAAQGA